MSNAAICFRQKVTRQDNRVTSANHPFQNQSRLTDKGFFPDVYHVQTPAYYARERRDSDKAEAFLGYERLYGCAKGAKHIRAEIYAKRRSKLSFSGLNQIAIEYIQLQYVRLFCFV